MQHKFPESFSNFQSNEIAAVQTKKTCTNFIFHFNPHFSKPVVEVPRCAIFSPFVMYLLETLNNLIKTKAENLPAEPNRKNLFLRLIGELRKEKKEHETINDVFHGNFKKCHILFF